MANPAGESKDEALKLDFDRRVMLQFRGSVVTSDAGLLAYRELDDALGLNTMAGETLADARTGKNERHALVGLLRQSVFGRLAGYEDVNDAERLRHDPPPDHFSGQYESPGPQVYSGPGAPERYPDQFTRPAGLLGPWRPTSSGALSPSVVATSLPRSNWSLLGDWSHWASAAPRRRPLRDHHLGRRQCRAAGHKRAGCWARDEADIAA